jgi:hypothetical protein
MTETPQLSGKDLAFQALAAYKATARTAPANTPAKPRRKRTVRRGDGRDPVSLGAALTGLGAELPLEAGLAGGSLLDRWTELCPQYVGRVEAAGYDEHTGRLDLRPTSHAYAAQLRLLGGQLARQINDKMGRPVVRTIRVLPVGNLTAAAAALVDQEKAEPQGPVKTRETASAGYRAALEAALTHQPEPRHTDPYIAAALERQAAALRSNRAPEPAAELDQLAERQVDRSEAVRRAALARKRQEQAGVAVPRKVFDVA